MPALRLRVKLSKEPTEPETAVPPEPQPGLFRRILHRAVSKTNLKSPPHAPPSPQAHPEADTAPPRRHGRGETTRQPRPKSSFRRLRSQPDSHRETEPETPKLRAFEAYVPRHAASDHRTTCSREGSTRFHSFDEDRRRMVLDSPPTDRPGTSPGLVLVTSQSQDQASRPAGAPKGDPLKVAGLDEDERRCRIVPLRRPTAVPAKRLAPRHSYKLASDPFEAPPELSDYQKFIQKAVEEDRRHREELWRTISQRSSRGRDAWVPNHPDLSPPERRGSTGGKRTSLLSYRSQADRQEKRAKGGAEKTTHHTKNPCANGESKRDPGAPKQVGKRTSNRSLRRLHDYFKPLATPRSPECR